MTTTYWILAAVAYIACGIVTAAMVHDGVRRTTGASFDEWAIEHLMLYGTVIFWPLVAPGIAIGWLASKMRKGNHDNA